jgi:rhodanese-related sulfurtransferase
MLHFFYKIFRGKQVNYSQLLRDGAQIIDVRTIAEFKRGHISGSVNVPLQSLSQSMGKISKNKPVITCCASGMRSATAKTILKSSGFSEVYNGGSWMSLEQKISKDGNK